MKKKTSIHDIARYLNISSATVSIVLSGKAREKNISIETEKKVADYAREIEYQPNLTAKSLRTGKSNLIAMLVESIDDPFFSSVAKGVESAAYDHGYKVFFSSTENEASKAKTLLNIFRERQVDGYIIAPPPGLAPEILALKQAGKSVVVFDRLADDLQTTTVLVNNYEGSYEAVQHLFTNGYFKIGFITLDSGQSQMKQRLVGYEQSISDAGLEKFVTSISYGTPQAQITSKIQGWLQANEQLDAVFFSTNYLTLAGLEAIKNLKLAIPSDLGVLSFDDSPYFKLNTPSITVVSQPIAAIAEQVVNTLMEELRQNADAESPEIPLSHIMLGTHLIVRESSTQQIINKKISQ